MGMSVVIRRLLVDALKPREISIVDLSKALCEVDGVEKVDAVITEVDAETETVKLSIIGPNIEYEKLMDVMGDYGLAVRSIDEVSVSRPARTR